MDALEEFDIVHDRRAAAPTKLAQAIKLMAEGFQLKRAQIRARHPKLSDAEVEMAFQAGTAKSRYQRRQSERAAPEHAVLCDPLTPRKDENATAALRRSTQPLVGRAGSRSSCQHEWRRRVSGP